MKRPALLIIAMQNSFALESAPFKVAQGKGCRTEDPGSARGVSREETPVIHILRGH
jgi:hypothetical protein